MGVQVPRALIVDDDASWQQILAELLTDSGLQVDVAGNAGQALSLIRAVPHRLAVVDLSLGAGDYANQEGLQVLDALRLHDPACPSILLTGFATVELAVSALTEHGALTCLRKESFQRAQFRQLVQRALSSASVPVRETASPEQGLELPAPNPSTAGRGQALVVEDDAGWRGILAELLCAAGLQVRACRSYGEALGHLRREKYALAVIDLWLEGAVAPATGPELDGFRLLASTRAGRIPTLVVSGVADAGNIERAYDQYGIFAFLRKQDFERQVFLQTVDEAVREVRGGPELDSLTGRERQVLDLLAQGMTNKEIAEALAISTNTVKRHLKAIFGKMEIHTRSAAAARAGGGSRGAE